MLCCQGRKETLEQERIAHLLRGARQARGQAARLRAPAGDLRDQRALARARLLQPAAAAPLLRAQRGHRALGRREARRLRLGRAAAAFLLTAACIIASM